MNLNLTNDSIPTLVPSLDNIAQSYARSDLRPKIANNILLSYVTYIFIT